MILNRKRVRRARSIDLPEPVIEFDENGLMKSMTRPERNIARPDHRGFMLAVYESVASYLDREGVASLYRIHEKPTLSASTISRPIAAKLATHSSISSSGKAGQIGERPERPLRNPQQPRVVEIPEEVHLPRACTRSSPEDRRASRRSASSPTSCCDR